jgi:hypothetical protein
MSVKKSVAYGANNKFAFLNLTGETPCTNALFGDPILGTVKACYVSDVPTQAPASTHSQPCHKRSLRLRRSRLPLLWCHHPYGTRLLHRFPLLTPQLGQQFPVPFPSPSASDNVAIAKVELYKEAILVGSTMKNLSSFLSFGQHQGQQWILYAYHHGVRYLSQQNFFHDHQRNCQQHRQHKFRHNYSEPGDIVRVA